MVVVVSSKYGDDKKRVEIVEFLARKVYGNDVKKIEVDIIDSKFDDFYKVLRGAEVDDEIWGVFGDMYNVKKFGAMLDKKVVNPICGWNDKLVNSFYDEFLGREKVSFKKSEWNWT